MDSTVCREKADRMGPREFMAAMPVTPLEGQVAMGASLPALVRGEQAAKGHWLGIRLVRVPRVKAEGLGALQVRTVTTGVKAARQAQAMAVTPELPGLTESMEQEAMALGQSSAKGGAGRTEVLERTEISARAGAEAVEEADAHVLTSTPEEVGVVVEVEAAKEPQAEGVQPAAVVSDCF